MRSSGRRLVRVAGASLLLVALAGGCGTNREPECEPVAVGLDEDCPPECPREVVAAKFESGDCDDYSRVKWCSDLLRWGPTAVAVEVDGAAYAANNPFGSPVGTHCESSNLPACACAMTCMNDAPFCWSEDAQ